MSTPTDRLVDHDSSGERRFYARVTPARPLYIPFGGNNLAMLLNLSENGLLVSTPAMLDLNSVFKISIRLNGLPKGIDVHVRTIWTSESNKRAGIQLLDLSDHDREQIRKWSALEASRGSNAAVPQEAPAAMPVKERPAQERPAVIPVTPPPSAPLPERPTVPAFLAPLPVSSDGSLLAPFPQATQLGYPLARVSAPLTRSRRKSAVPALVAWGAVGAVLSLGAALFLDRGLAQQLLHRPGMSPVEVTAPVGTANSAAVKHAENAPTSNPQPAASVEPTFRRAVARLESQAESTLASPLPLTTEPARDALNRDALRPDTLSINPAASSKRPPTAYADSSGSAYGTFGAATGGAATGAAPKSPSAMPASTNPDAAGPNKTLEPSVVKPANVPSASAPAMTPSTAAPTTTANSVPVPSSPSAIAGSIGNSNSSAAMNSSAPTHTSSFVPSTSNSVPVAANPTPDASRSTWPASSTPVAAGKARNSLLRSHPADPAVVQMDVNPGPAMAITSPRGIGSSYVTIPGERVIDSAGMTLHLRRAVRVPAEHWIWSNKKQVALGELATRIDPQPSHQPASGSITVQATIDKEGRVTDLKPLNGSFSFLPGVARAVREWRYEPTFLDGKPVETRADIEIDFHSPTSAQH